MRFSISPVVVLLASALSLSSVVNGFSSSPTFFKISTPSVSSPWIQGGPNPLIWESSKAENIVQFDVELVRLSGGVLRVAKNVPVKDNQAVVDVEGIPEGNDYFCVFMDSYDGTVYARSSKFSITQNATVLTAVSATLTMTVTGAPNPTRAFETTLVPLETARKASSFYGSDTTGALPSAAQPKVSLGAGSAVWSMVGMLALGAMSGVGAFLG